MWYSKKWFRTLSWTLYAISVVLIVHQSCNETSTQGKRGGCFNDSLYINCKSRNSYNNPLTKTSEHETNKRQTNECRGNHK